MGVAGIFWSQPPWKWQNVHVCWREEVCFWRSLLTFVQAGHKHPTKLFKLSSLGQTHGLGEANQLHRNQLIYYMTRRDIYVQKLEVLSPKPAVPSAPGTFCAADLDPVSHAVMQPPSGPFELQYHQTHFFQPTHISSAPPTVAYSPHDRGMSGLRGVGRGTRTKLRCQGPWRRIHPTVTTKDGRSEGVPQVVANENPRTSESNTLRKRSMN